MNCDKFLDLKKTAKDTDTPQIAVSQETGMRYMVFPNGDIRVRMQKVSETLLESVLNECIVTPFNTEV